MVQNNNKDVDIGSYPFFRAGKLGVAIVLRSSIQSQIDKCNLEIQNFIKDLLYRFIFLYSHLYLFC